MSRQGHDLRLDEAADRREAGAGRDPPPPRVESALRLRHATTALLLLIASPLLAACTDFAAQAVRYNLIVEETQNSKLLLNVVRASLGRQLHFTRFEGFRGEVRPFGGVGLTIPFELGAQVEIEGRPAFDLAVQDDPEFLRGLRAPVDLRTLDHFLRQPVPPDLILQLLIETIVLWDEGPPQSFYNRPASPADFEHFQQRLGTLLDQGLTSEIVLAVRDIGPFLSASTAANLEHLAVAEQEGLRVERIDPQTLSEEEREHLEDRDIDQPYRLRRIGEVARLCLREPREPLLAAARCAGPPAPYATRARFAVDDPGLFSDVEGVPASFATATGRIELHTRSIEGVLRYLGDIVAAQNRPAAEGGYLPTMAAASGRQPLLVVTSGAPPGGGALAAVEYGGRRYVVPAGEQAGWSAQVLAIVSQLIAQSQPLDAP